MRDMARVVTLNNIVPMLNKDRIICAEFKETAYTCIVPKETAHIGDFYIMFEADAILPEKPEFEFLRKRCYKEELHGFLIKAMTMGQREDGTKVKSWCLCMKPNEVGLTEKEIEKLKSGQDLTERLEVRKYEPIEDASPTSSKKAYPKWVKFCLSHALTRWIGRIWQKNHQNSAGGFPREFISASDETTLQNLPGLLDKIQNEKVTVTFKHEGQSCTALFDYDSKKKKVGKFYVCSRNNAYKLKCNNDFWNFAVNNDIENKLKQYYKKHGVWLILQCEQCGPGIQNNIYNLKHIDWYVYTIKNMLTGDQYTYSELSDICKELGLKPVACIQDNVTLSEIMPDLKTAITYAENVYWSYDKEKDEPIFNYCPKDGEKLNKSYWQAEGIVVRTIPYNKDKNIGYSFKLKNIQYSEHGLSAMSKEVMAFRSIN